MIFHFEIIVSPGGTSPCYATLILLDNLRFIVLFVWTVIATRRSVATRKATEHTSMQCTQTNILDFSVSNMWQYR